MGTAPTMSPGLSIRTACSAATMTTRANRGILRVIAAGADADLGHAESALGAFSLRAASLN